MSQKILSHPKDSHATNHWLVLLRIHVYILHWLVPMGLFRVNVTLQI